VDGFLLVVRAHRTPREMLRDSVDTLGRNRTLGLVWNDDDRTAVGTYADTTVPGGWRRYLSLGAPSGA
jgi:Mrp family chromosome partitioning ATPase